MTIENTHHFIALRVRFRRGLRLGGAASIILVALSTAAAGPHNAPAAAQPPGALSAEDVNLYLDVMHAAARRAHHPTATDTAARRQAEQARRRQRQAYDTFAAKHKNGSKPTAEEISALRASNPSPEELQAMHRSDLLQQRPDQLIAEECQVEPRYHAVAVTIERFVALQQQRRPTAADPATLSEAVRARVAKERAVEAANARLLEPRLHQIRELIEEVRHGEQPDLD